MASAETEMLEQGVTFRSKRRALANHQLDQLLRHQLVSRTVFVIGVIVGGLFDEVLKKAFIMNLQRRKKMGRGRGGGESDLPSPRAYLAGRHLAY